MIPDAPYIRRAERLGVEVKEYFCPLCGEPCETIYKCDGEIVGCDNCVEAFDASELEEE